MHLSDFDYELPPELIAAEPARPRDSSRMMVVEAGTTFTAGTARFIDSSFKSLPDFLRPSDVLVINDTRVLHARLYGKLERRSGTTRDIEVLFAAPVGGRAWEVMCRPGKRVRPGDRVVFSAGGDGAFEGVFGESRDFGLRLLTVSGTEPVEMLLDRHGHTPLPPYIERMDRDTDAVEYQTVYARNPGAVAAPTAGLHFTPGMFESLAARGIQVERITLHVGVGTFIPVRSENPEEHVLKPERFEITEDTAARLNAARDAGRRIVAVGTTTTRTLEYVFGRDGCFVAGRGDADIFILPGYTFRAVDALLTNFHLPRSTLLMLVSAFAGSATIHEAYRRAVELRYRFYSYGDCMLITR